MNNPIASWWRRRQNRTEMAVMGCLLKGDNYVTDMQRRIGGSWASINLALFRLEGRGDVWADWAGQAPGAAPRRRRYGLTDKALEARVIGPSA